VSCRLRLFLCRNLSAPPGAHSMLIHRCLAVACRTIAAGAILATSLFSFCDPSRPSALPFRAQQSRYKVSPKVSPVWQLMSDNGRSNPRSKRKSGTASRHRDCSTLPTLVTARRTICGWSHIAGTASSESNMHLVSRERLELAWSSAPADFKSLE
jgi:hypothetical protein